MIDILLSILKWACGIGFALMFLLMTAGEIVGHSEVRRFLFWLRGRSEKDGKPTRRFPLL